jgi:hypothetical protein
VRPILYLYFAPIKIEYRRAIESKPIDGMIQFGHLQWHAVILSRGKQTINGAAHNIHS